MITTTIINTALELSNPNRSIVIRGFKASSYSESPSQPNFEEVNVQGRSSPIQFYNNGSARTISFSMIFMRDMFLSSEASSNIYVTSPAMSPSTGAKKIQGGILGLYVDDSGVWQASTEKVAELLKQSSHNSYDGSEVILPESSQYVTVDRINATRDFVTFINKLKALNYPVYTNNGVISPKCILTIGDPSSVSDLRLEGYCKTSIDYSGLEGENTFIMATVRFDFTEVVHYSWSATQILQNAPNRVTLPGGSW